MLPNNPTQGRPTQRAPVVLPGGTLAGVAQSPDVQVFEMLWSCQPNEAWYDPSRAPNNPTQAEVGSFTVAKGQTLLVTDFCFEAYYPSSIVAGGAEPLGEKQLRGQVGYQFMIKGRLPGTAEFQIEAVPSIFERRQFKQPGTVSAGDFALKRATAYGSASGGGTSILPPRLWRHGDLKTPAVFVIEEGEQAVLRVVIYRAIGIPLTFIEGRLLGYLGPSSVLDKMLKSLQNSV